MWRKSAVRALQPALPQTPALVAATEGDDGRVPSGLDEEPALVVEADDVTETEASDDA
jgi:hypothetical protein